MTITRRPGPDSAMTWLKTWTGCSLASRASHAAREPWRDTNPYAGQSCAVSRLPSSTCSPPSESRSSASFTPHDRPATGPGARPRSPKLISLPPAVTNRIGHSGRSFNREGDRISHALSVRLRLATRSLHLDSGDLATYPVTGTPLERPWHLCTTSEPTAATRLFLRHVCDPGRVGEAAFHTRYRPKG